jgi:hypothetical protein
MDNVMNPNIYLNAIVFFWLAQHGQKERAVPEPEFRPFDLTYLTGAPVKRGDWLSRSRYRKTRNNLSEALRA